MEFFSDIQFFMCAIYLNLWISQKFFMTLEANTMMVFNILKLSLCHVSTI